MLPYFGDVSAAEIKNSKTQINSNSPDSSIHGEADDTDIFAVPLDNDEESEEEEMKWLEEKGKEAQSRQPKKTSTSAQKPK